MFRSEKWIKCDAKHNDQIVSYLVAATLAHKQRLFRILYDMSFFVPASNLKCFPLLNRL